MKSVDVCIPVLNDLEIAYSLQSIIDSGFADSVVVCISDNASENDLESIVKNYASQLEIVYSKSEIRISFEMNLLRSAQLGTSEFITFCGAGDEYMGHGLMDDVRILEENNEFSLSGSAQLIKNLGVVRRIAYGFDPLADFDVINEAVLLDWIFNGPLSGIGGWVVRRFDLSQAVNLVGTKIEGTKFPQIIFALFLPRSGKVIQTNSTWYISTYEMKRSRMRNSIYENVDWIELMMGISTELPNFDRIRSYLHKLVTANFVGFKAFGNQETLRRSKCLATNYGGLKGVSKLIYCVTKLVPSSICLALVFVKRKLLFLMSSKVTHFN